MWERECHLHRDGARDELHPRAAAARGGRRAALGMLGIPRFGRPPDDLWRVDTASRHHLPRAFASTARVQLWDPSGSFCISGMRRVAALAAVLLLPLVWCSSTICAADGESE